MEIGPPHSEPMFGESVSSIPLLDPMVVLASLLSLALLVDATPKNGEEGALTPFADLASPYFEVRSAAQQRLLATRFEDAQKVAAKLLVAPDPKLRLAGVEWYREQLRFPKPREVDVAAFESALAKETDPTVRSRAIQVAAEIGSVVDSLKKAAGEGRIPKGEIDTLLRARLVRLCEQVMLDGEIPGFFDGQFAAMHSLDKSALARITMWAWDPRVHPVLRKLMIMALHEPRPRELEQLLRPLLVPPKFEVDWMSPLKRMGFRASQPEEIQAVLRAEYSQYARFSLAKAGIAGPIDAKIQELLADFENQMERVQKIREREDELGIDVTIYVEAAYDTLFQVGYHHQQLDRYDAAEQVYRKIVDSGEEVSARIWSYYNLACIRAIQGRNDDAIVEFQHAIDVGFNDLRWATRDGDLKPLRDDPRFQRMLAGLPPTGDKAPPR